MALKRAAKDTRLQGRDEAHAERPSAGDAPRALLTMNHSSPSSTSAAGGSLSLIHPPASHETHSHLSILVAKGQRHQHLPVGMKRRPPAQGKKGSIRKQIERSRDSSPPRHQRRVAENQAAVDSILPLLSDRNQTKSPKSIPWQTLDRGTLTSQKTAPAKMQGPPSSPEIIRHWSCAVAATTSEHSSSAI